MMRKKPKFYLFSDSSKSKKLIDKSVGFMYAVLGFCAYYLLVSTLLPLIHIPVTKTVKLTLGVVVALIIVIAAYRYYELPKGVMLYQDYMQFEVHAIPDSRHRNQCNPILQYRYIQTVQICKGKRPPKSVLNSKDDGWFDMGGSGDQYVRITAEIDEEEIFIFYVDDPEAFVADLRDYMINAGAGKIWGQ